MISCVPALVRDKRELDADSPAEKRACKMLDVADPAGCDIELARVGARVGHKLSD